MSHLEIIALHEAFSKLKPDVAGSSVTLDAIEGELSIDLGLRKPTAALLTSEHLKLTVPANGPASAAASAAAEQSSAEQTACLPWALLAKVAKKKRAGVWEVYDEAGEGEEARAPDG